MRPDLGHPLLRGAIGWWTFRGNGRIVYDEFNQHHGTLHTDVKWTRGKRGEAIYNTTASAGNSCLLPPITSAEHLSGYITKYISVVAFLEICTGAQISTVHGNSFPRVVDKGTGNNSAGGWGYYYDNGSGPRVVPCVNGSGPTISIPSAYDFAGTAVDGVVIDGWADTSYFYRNGHYIGSVASTTPFPTTTANMRIINRPDAARPYKLPLYSLVIFNRVVKAAEMRAWADNPWAPFKRSLPVWIPNVAGGAVADSDTLTPSISENTVIDKVLEKTDTLTPAITESTLVAKPFADSDTLTPSISEDTARGKAIAQSDTLTPSLTPAIIARVIEQSEIFLPSISEAYSTDRLFEQTDALTPSVTETEGLAVYVQKAASDTITPSVGMDSSISVRGIWAEDASASNSWSEQGAGSGTWTEDEGVDSTWTE